MTDPKAPKKSEVIEVRIPYPTKTAFMEKARAEGIAASEIVRQSIDRYLEADAAPTEPETLQDRAISFFRNNSRSLGLLLAGAGSAVAITLAVSPATARPDLKAAFTTLDADGNGVVSLGEFTQPKAAISTEITGPIAPTTGSVAIAAPAQTGASFVRFMLDTGTADGVLPLMVMIDVPKGGLSEDELATLIGKAFSGLDKNADGKLSIAEFSS
ncbi:MAG: hypothetical protein ABIQ30_07140 [Devosia sp.]